ncbi:MAG: hypothetical protein DI585_02530 [Pseudomonas fluorescens]|nr:MAG: hypothetical protein DI585_02530 [Pseudomonas fluorescens]
MYRPASLVFIFLASTCLALPVMAQQYATQVEQTRQTFNSQASNGGQTFAYTYNTALGETRTLTFRLNAEDIARGGAEFKPWNNAQARSTAVAAAQARAAQLERKNLKATISPLPNGMNVRISGYDVKPDGPEVKNLNKEISLAYDITVKNFAKENLYRAISTGPNTTSIMPDHPAIVTRYVNAMRPVAKAIREQVPGAADGPREFINAAMNWLQTIPYDRLDDRATSNGAGFQTPYGLIQGNSGDCDTKATALAALIRSIYPTIPLAIVYVPEHAFLAIGLPQSQNDFALRTQNGTYILADATGPALAPLGYIDAKTQARTGGAKTEILPVP